MATGYTLIDVSVLPAFLIAVMVILLAPGPDMAFMIATGLGGGRRAATLAAFGITAGVSVYVILTALGLGAFLAAAPSAADAIRLAGAAYLAYLAWTTWRSSGSPVTASAAPARVFRRGFLVNLSNPKIMLFFTAFLPQFLGEATANPVFQLLMLGVVLQALGLLSDLAVGYAAGAVRDWVLLRSRVRVLLDRLSAGVYGGLAGFLVIDVVRNHLLADSTT
ncbi:LysE family translocator [Amycolatopsis aidingensis]|uniref:LysE family translocator n=1 Tax=Amycolatopsis aidingensis TaxID=2842453 RepID=UPI001C0E1575|nr:LysE family translocator [Amycolatopsis aidingensis]